MKSEGEDFRKDYEFDKEKDEIDSGSFGTVYRVTEKNTQEKRAAKIIDIQKFKRQLIKSGDAKVNENFERYIKSIKDEIKWMHDVAGDNGENENTVKCYGYYEKENIELAIIMELCDENLGEIFVKNNFSFYDIREILKQLNNSFKIMYQKKLAHRDLKPSNILVKYKNKDDKSKFILKLCDYGEAKRLTTTRNVFLTKVGTQAFMAPEVLNADRFDLKCDLWSLGVIIYYFYFRDYPYHCDKSEIQLINEIKNYGQKFFKKSNNKDFDDLVRKLLIADPKERISWEDYFKHPFIIYESEILLILKIEKKELNKNIYFLNDSEGKGDKNEEISNLTKDDCKIFINDKPVEFSRYFKPEKESEYKIKIIIKKNFKNCSSMFSNNDNIIKIDLSSFDTSEVTNMYYMFGRCHFLSEVNLSNCQTDKVTNMSYLFNKCSTLKKVVFPNSFDTKNVENMSYMFNCCYDLEDIHFPKSFVTKKVKNLENMFSKCYKLEKLNLENFETYEVTNISYMFEQCYNLKEIIINPDKFKTDKVVKMGRMFNSCESLEKLNIIKNFEYSKVKFMNHMFQNCDKLKEIDLSGMKDIKDDVNMNKIFDNLKDVKIIVNSKTIDKFKEKFQGINFVKN